MTIFVVKGTIANYPAVETPIIIAPCCFKTLIYSQSIFVFDLFNLLAVPIIDSKLVDDTWSFVKIGYPKKMGRSSGYRFPLFKSHNFASSTQLRLISKI